MGKAVVQLFEEAEQLAGLQGKLMLAGITRMTTGQAASVADSPELIAQFRDALAILKKQSSKAAVPGLENVVSAGVLRKHIASFLDLITQRSLILGNALDSAKRINELAAATLEVARVSVWLLDDARTKISCFDLYERDNRTHSAGLELNQHDFAPYFLALESQCTIAAHDAQSDPRTSCFTASYLKPLNITSMLDVPIWVNSKMVGVVCHEHQGPPRRWNADEERFAYLMAGFMSLALERTRSDTANAR